MDPKILDSILLQFRDTQPKSTKTIINNSNLARPDAISTITYLFNNNLIQPSTKNGRDNSGLYPAYTVTELGSEKARRGGFANIDLDNTLERDLTESSINANKSNVKTNKWSLIISGVALIVAIISLLVSLLTA